MKLIEKIECLNNVGLYNNLEEGSPNHFLSRYKLERSAKKFYLTLVHPTVISIIVMNLDLWKKITKNSLTKVILG